jgi:hypothetical protein
MTTRPPSNHSSQSTNSPISSKRRRESADLEDQSNRNYYHRGERPTQRIPTFACPYYKFDPIRYSKSDVSCSRTYLADISRLKQHLYRSHYTLMSGARCSPNIRSFSPELGTELGTYPARARRHLQKDAQKRAHNISEDMSDDQFLEIKVKRPRQEKSVAWFDIYTTLFPGSELPRSPYATADPAVSRFVESFRDWGPEDFSRRVREQFSTRSACSDKPQAQEDSPRLQTDVLDTAVSVVLEECLRRFVQYQGNSSKAVTNVDSIQEPPPYDTALLLDGYDGKSTEDCRPVANGEVALSGTEPFSPPCTDPLQRLVAFEAAKYPNHNMLGRSSPGTQEPLGTTRDAISSPNGDNGIGQTGQLTHTEAGTQNLAESSPGTVLENKQSKDFTPPNHAARDREQASRLSKYGELGLFRHDAFNNTPYTQHTDKPLVPWTLSVLSAENSPPRVEWQQKKGNQQRQKRLARSSGKAERPMSCISIKGPKRDQCPDECRIWSNHDIYSVQVCLLQ